MKKTLLEHHYELRIQSLKDESTTDYAECLALVERLATEHGWKHLCEGKCINIKLRNVYTDCQCTARPADP